MDDIISKINKLGGMNNQLIGAIKISSLETSLIDSMYDLEIENEKCISRLQEGKFGIYFFSAFIPPGQFSSIDEFGMQWGAKGSKNERIAKSPIYYKGRGKVHADKLNRNEYIPFYLGKAKDIKKRVSGHIFDNETSTTYSMKLRGRGKSLNHFKFKLGYIYMDVNADSYFAIENVERYLRELLNPIIGKQ